MELAHALRRLGRHPLVLGLGALVAVAASILSVYRVENGSLKARSLEYAAASTQILIDSEPSSLGSVSQSFEQLSTRAEVYANLMASPTLLEVIARPLHLSAGQLYAAGPVNAAEPRVEQEPTALKRNVEITGETKPYRLNFESQANLPTITINTQAPTTAQAIGLANAAAIGLKKYVANVATAEGIREHSRVVIRQLGSATGGVVDPGISKTLAVMVFVLVMALWCVLMLAASRSREIWRASAPDLAADEGPDDAWSELANHQGNGRVHDEEAERAGILSDPEDAEFATPPEPDEDHPAPVPERGMR